MDNRRVHPRFGLEMTPLMENQHGTAVQLEDLSRGGVRFVSEEPYTSGTVISFSWEEGQSLGEVLSCDPLPSDESTFAVRAVFEKLLPLPLVGLLLVQAELGESHGLTAVPVSS